MPEFFPGEVSPDPLTCSRPCITLNTSSCLRMVSLMFSRHGRYLCRGRSSPVTPERGPMPDPNLLIAGGRSNDRIDLREARAALLAAEGSPTEFAAEVEILREGSFDFGGWTENIIKVDADLMAAFQANYAAGARGKNADGSPASLPVDIDHETREAVGWIDGLTVADGKLMAAVTWNAAGVRMLRDDQFRHMSVMFNTTYKDPEGKTWGATLWGASVTNYPRIKDMEAVKLAAKLAGGSETPDNAEPTRGTDMDSKLMAKALGLPEDATDEQIFAAATAANADDPNTDGELVAMKATLDGMRASVTALETKNAEQAAEILTAKAEKVIDAHKAAGRLTDGHLVHADGKPNALAALATSDPEAFDLAVATFPVTVDFSTRGSSAGGGEGGDAMATFEAAIAKAQADGAPTYQAAVDIVKVADPALVAKVYHIPATG